MVRLRIHTAEDHEVPSLSQLKACSTTSALLKVSINSPLRQDGGSDRKQRVLRKLENNPIQLNKNDPFGPVPPSKFARKVVPKRHNISPSAPLTKSPLQKASPNGQIDRAIRRRIVIESDSESDAGISEVFGRKLSLRGEKHSAPAPLAQELKTALSAEVSNDLAHALRRQGFEFVDDVAAEPISQVDNLCSSRPTTASGPDTDALLSFEPLRSRSPVRLPPERPSTPTKLPSSTKVKLQSPTKNVRLPQSPHKASSADFWSPTAVNDWIDQYSPEKPIQSPFKQQLSAGMTDAIPLSSLKSFSSPTKASRQAKKDFDARKHQIAADFLAELDNDITNNKIGDLSRSAGGVQLIWSNKLNSTAGRAHWRKQETRIKHSDGTTSVQIKHTTSIELAEKVLDDETRLINTIAHEFCHLATFMIDGVRTNPHGREFKAWAHKCSLRYANREVRVTTKHSYDIDYKYIWECSSCGTEYKRHSKSVDPAKHRCGACRSALVQIKPVPRKTAVTDYQRFIKDNFQRVKNLDRSASHATVMETLGRLYREEKASVVQVHDVDILDNLADVMQVFQLDES